MAMTNAAIQGGPLPSSRAERAGLRVNRVLAYHRHIHHAALATTTRVDDRAG